jgi:hypothetical protein
MRPRDRLGLASVLAIVVIGAAWLLLVSPERSKVNSLSTQISSEQSALTQTQAQLDSARSSVAGYVGHIHAIDAAVRSVPTTPAEAQLIKTIVKLAGTKVDFKDLDIGSGSPSSAGPTALGLTFTFSSNYGNLQSFLSAIDALTTTDGGQISSKGRLFTIQSVSLTPTPGGNTSASIIASVYEQSPATVTGATGATGVTGATGAP